MKRSESLGRIFEWILIVLVIAFVGYFVWTWFSYKTCDSWSCFDSRLEKCAKTDFIGGEKMIFEYSIRGKTGDSCEVDIKLLQGDLNNQDSLKLEGNKMKCMIPYGSVIIPESDIDNCHGTLKEGLQDLIIRDLHTYIVQNLGKINLEVLPAPSD